MSVSDVPLRSSSARSISAEASHSNTDMDQPASFSTSSGYLTLQHFDKIMAEFDKARSVQEGLSSKLSALIDTQCKLSQALETCNETLTNHTKLLEQHSTCLADNDLKFSELQGNIELLEKRIGDLAGRVDNNSSSSDLAVGSGLPVASDAEFLLREIKEREKRCLNLLLFNVAESSSSDVKQRIAEDTRIVHSILDTLGGSHVELAKVVRLGKRGSRTRPLKLVLPSRNDVIECLKHKHKLGGTGYRISADLTELQRSHMDGLRKQLKERVDHGETDLTIKYIEGLPKIVKKHEPKK